MTRIHPRPEQFAFTVGGLPPIAVADVGADIEVFTEDCFSGQLTSVTDRPREVAPWPRVNPLTGPIELRGVRRGDVLAVHLVDLKPARDWGVSTMSPNFGALSGTRQSPNLQPETAEHVWIWSVDPAARTVRTGTADGRELVVPLRPFHGTVGVAPAHGEVRTSAVPDAFGGNLDVPMLGAGATLYVRSNVDGAMLYLGDGHFAQGDGEFCGTAVEGAMVTRLRTAVLAENHLDAGDVDWPRIETDDEIITIGAGRPLEDAARVAVRALVRWVAHGCGLSEHDSYQLVSQGCTTRVGNLVNPAYTVSVSLPKKLLPGRPTLMGGTHDRLRTDPAEAGA